MGAPLPVVSGRVQKQLRPQAKLVQVHVGEGNRVSPGAVVRLQEALQPTRHLEGTAYASGDHRQVIGGIPQEGLPPIHDAHRFVFQGEQEVLAQEIAVKEAGRLGRRQVLPHPTADVLPIGAGHSLEYQGEGQCVLTASLVSGQDRPERCRVEIMHPGGDASNQFPRAAAGKAGGPKIGRPPR
jgi:hypothetical protein